MPATTAKKVLVVEDDDLIRDALAEMLGLDDYVVVAAQHGAEALETVRCQCPDAIVLDLMMPVMDGWSFLSAARTEKLCVDVSVIVTSARHDLAEIALSLGVQVCMAKPFDLYALVGAVDRLTQRRAN